MPDALARKYPNARLEWAWQYVFPAAGLSVDPRSGKRRRHHIDEKSLQRAVKSAARKCGFAKTATCSGRRATTTATRHCAMTTGPTTDREKNATEAQRRI